LSWVPLPLLKAKKFLPISFVNDERSTYAKLAQEFDLFLLTNNRAQLFLPVTHGLYAAAVNADKAGRTCIEPLLRNLREKIRDKSLHSALLDALDRGVDKFLRFLEA
jgi:hypothetical protein